MRYGHHSPHCLSQPLPAERASRRCWPSGDCAPGKPLVDAWPVVAVAARQDSQLIAEGKLLQANSTSVLARLGVYKRHSSMFLEMSLVQRRTLAETCGRQAKHSGTQRSQAHAKPGLDSPAHGRCRRAEGLIFVLRAPTQRFVIGSKERALRRGETRRSWGRRRRGQQCTLARRRAR